MCGVVACVWTLAEPYKAGVEAQDWIAMFRTNGYTNEGQRAVLPADSITVYRGTVPDRQIGMAWTSDYATAKEFACDRMSSRARGNIYRTMVRPDVLLAYIHDNLGRGEHEYVVDQNGLDSSLIDMVTRGDDVCS